MSDFYTRLQGTATKLMDKFQQGTVRYIALGETTGPAYDPVVGEPTPYTVNATVRGVQQQYIQDGYISASDLQAILSVFEVEPSTAGTLEIDGKEYQIIQVDALPGAGTTVAWRVFCKA